MDADNKYPCPNYYVQDLLIYILLTWGFCSAICCANYSALAPGFTSGVTYNGSYALLYLGLFALQITSYMGSFAL